MEVLTPPAVENPGMEVHIHPFQLYSVYKKRQEPLYLHTSPEFAMKQLLADPLEGLDKIYQFSYCFRDEPNSPIHRNQFIMLEWYRKDERYEQIMMDIESLIEFVLSQSEVKKLPLRKEFQAPKFIKKTMAELFQEEMGVEILNYLDKDSIKKLIMQYPEIPVPKADLEWDDYFFLIYLNKIEPNLTKYPLLLIYEFPAPLSALSTLKKSDPRVCERFEVYVNGIELCNSFNELTDAQELIERFTLQNELKNKLYHYELPPPHRFYEVMKRGYPPSAGIALGVERLLYSLFEIENPFYF